MINLLKEPTYYLYKIENKVDGKIYIGITVNPVGRKSAHFSDLTHNHEVTGEYPLYRAMKKYGKENFEFKILAKTKNADKIADMETKSIRKCEEELGLELYNLAKTSSYHFFNKQSNPVDIYNLDGEFIISYESMNKASIYMDSSFASILTARNNKKATKGYFVLDKGQTPTEEMLKQPYKDTEIYSYDLATGEIEIDDLFNPYKRRIVGSKLYVWKYELEDIDSLVEIYDTRVFAKNIETGEIISFKTLQDMADHLKSSVGAVCDAINKNNRHKGWVIQRGGDLDELELKRTILDNRLLLIKDGVETIFKSKMELAKFLGVGIRTVEKIINGTQKKKINYAILNMSDLSTKVTP